MPTIHVTIFCGFQPLLQSGIRFFNDCTNSLCVIEQAPRLIVKEDEQTSKVVQDILEKEGIDIYLNTKMQ